MNSRDAIARESCEAHRLRPTRAGAGRGLVRRSRGDLRRRHVPARSRPLQASRHVLKHFFGWQAAGFLVAAIVVSRRGRRRRAACSAAIWSLSTAALLACRAGCRDGRQAGRVAAVDRLCRAGNAAGDRPGWPASDTRPGASPRPPSTRRWCRSASSWASCTRSLRRSWPRWRVAAAAARRDRWLRRLAKIDAIAESLGSHARSVGTQEADSGIRIVAWCLIEVIWAILAVEFIGASTGEVASDAARVHLPYMLQVIADHGMSHQYACWHRLQPMAVQTYSAAIAAVGIDRRGEMVLLARAGGAGAAGGRGGRSAAAVRGSWVCSPARPCLAARCWRSFPRRCTSIT